MNDKPFFDTNVILYAFRQDDTRSQVAETLLAAGGILSVQVLNEFVAVARRKLGQELGGIGRVAIAAEGILGDQEFGQHDPRSVY